MKSKSRARISSGIAMAVVIVAIASFARSAYMKRDAAVSPQREKQVRLETELITLQPSGFEPNEIRRPQGAFILGVDNRAGVESIELQFRRVEGQRLNALQAPKRKVSWREVVDLPPGEYVLAVAHHPEWTCNVTILPR
ncbi:MAG TPA: hypothetical protein VF290_18395 [Pyrinomonadaceae bacterium]